MRRIAAAGGGTTVRGGGGHRFRKRPSIVLPHQQGTWWHGRSAVPEVVYSGGGGGGVQRRWSRPLYYPSSSPSSSSSSSSSSLRSLSGSARARQRATMNGRTYEEAIATLGRLISNAETMTAWAKERLTNKELDVREEMFALLRRIDVDVSKLSCVHVAGTKGKGSTCAFAESILRRGYGLRTGLYTSPHLVHARERIRIDGKPLEEDKFAKYFWETWDRLHATQAVNQSEGRAAAMPAFFHFLTLMAFRVFQEEAVDVAVVEVGVGGRTDATNVVSPDACGISALGYDHQNVLGNTLTEIAYEKAGIMKAGVHAFTVPQEEEAMQSLVKQATVKQVALDIVPPMESWGCGPHKLGLLGEFQKYNASLAVALCREWLRKNIHRLPSLNSDSDPSAFVGARESTQLPPSFRRGLAECRWPGRAQLIQLPTNSPSDEEVWLYLDGAHTEESMEVCARWYSGDDRPTRITKGDETDSDNSEERRVLIFNCNQNRSPSKLLTKLAAVTTATTCGSGSARQVPFDEVIFTTLATQPGKDVPVSPSTVVHKRNADPLHWQRVQADAWRGILLSLLPLRNADANPHAQQSDLDSHIRVVDSIKTAIDVATASSSDQEQDPTIPRRRRTRVLVTGSLYLIGGVLDVLLTEGVLPSSTLDL